MYMVKGGSRMVWFWWLATHFEYVCEVKRRARVLSSFHVLWKHLKVVDDRGFTEYHSATPYRALKVTHTRRNKVKNNIHIGRPLPPEPLQAIKVLWTLLIIHSYSKLGTTHCRKLRNSEHLFKVCLTENELDFVQEGSEPT